MRLLFGSVGIVPELYSRYQISENNLNSKIVKWRILSLEDLLEFFIISLHNKIL